MNIHLGFALQTGFLALFFLGGRHWSRKKANPYPRWRPGVTEIDRQVELWNLNRIGRSMMIMASLVWIVSAAVYLAIIFQFVTE